MKSPAFLLLILGLFAALCFSGWKTWEQARAYEERTLLIIEQLETETRLEHSGKQFLEILSFGFYDGYSRQLQELNNHKALQAAYHESVRIMTAVFFVLAGAIIILAWLARRRLDDAAYAMLAVAFVALVVGLSTPILSVEASRDLPVLGETVFQFQSKGIVSTILALREHGNLWLAVLLFCFSIVIPVLKTLVVWLTMFSSTHSFSIRGLHFSHHMGKWSMADVFVVAILVAFFANSSGEGLTQAEIQAGLWFFAAYVVLSLLGTQLISGQLSRMKTETPER